MSDNTELARATRRCGSWPTPGPTPGIVTSLLFAWAAPGALAQATDDSGNAATSIAQLEEIVVTARRREESLQDAPVAVSALGAAALEERQVGNIADVGAFVPNVQFDAAAPEAGGGGASALFIRGIGQTDYVITIEPGVAVYLDGVYISRSFGSLLDTVDLERVEVLRGPQGALFGKNTIGGALVLTSKRPSEEPAGSVSLTGGSLDRFDAKFAVSGALSEHWRTRFSGARQQRDGYVDRVLTGDTQGDQDSLSARWVTEFVPSESFAAVLALDGTRSREEAAALSVMTRDETAPFALDHNINRFPACNPFDPANTGRFNDPNCYNSQYTSRLSERISYNSGPNQSDADVYGASLTLDGRLSAVDLKSITAYRKVDVRIAQEVDGVPTFMGDLFQDYELGQRSQELQLSGSAFADRLQYLLGVFYLNESGNQRFPIRTDFLSFTSGGAVDNDSYAAFGQATYDLTESLALTVGARWTSEERSFTPAQQIDWVNPAYTSVGGILPGVVFFPPVIPAAVGGQLAPFFAAGVPLLPSVKATTEDEQFTPSFTLDYRWSPEVMTYLSYSNGFKGGGFTLRALPPIIPGVTTTQTDPARVIPSFGPEEAEVIELGLKSDWFDRRLRLNLAGFVTDYSDLQITVLIGGLTPTVQNSGDARLKGLELESEFVPSSRLRFNLSAGYLENEYRRVSPEAVMQGVTLDSKLVNAPEWTVNAGSTVTLFDSALGSLSLRADYFYRAAMFKDPQNNPLLRASAYDLINASLNYVSADSHWNVSVGGSNLDNTTYLVTGVFNSAAGWVYGVPSRPREWFLTVGYRF